MADARKMFDGYDLGVRYADEYLGRIFNALADQRVLDETAIVISADHGETLPSTVTGTGADWRSVLIWSLRGGMV